MVRIIKKLSYICSKILILLDKFFSVFTKKNVFIHWCKYFLLEQSYKSIKILDRKVSFFVPNELTSFMVDSYFTKEPETLEWIDKFEKKEDLIFWDIGANIGLYSIYNSLKNAKALTIAFEPSSSNLRVLTRNISINNLEKKIKVMPMPLTNTASTFQIMNEKRFQEGGALNSFGETLDFKGQKFEPQMKYSLFGTSINDLIEKEILDVPDYIKIDVDGIEHLILEGGNVCLKNEKVKSLSIEINEDFEKQLSKILSLMKSYNFNNFHKNRNDKFYRGEFAQTYNYIFTR